MLQHPPASVHNLLIVLPTWVGDLVMATPTLRALRRRFAGARLTAVGRPAAGAVLDACPWIDRLILQPQRRPAILAGNQVRQAVGERIDLAVLLPNSFRAALLAVAAGARRRLGYDRDGRGLLLTDRLLPLRDRGRFVPHPTLHSYLALARYARCTVDDASMALWTREDDDAWADALIADTRRGDGPVVLLNPGAKYGAAKMWPADRFAAVADALIDRRGATVLVNGSPAERAVLDEVHAAARHDLIDLPARGSDLRRLKSIVQRSDLMITNDTGPRHFAAALGTPVVTVFGPTDPRWSEIDFADETQLRIDVDCGPCQLKRCPLDHRCMTRIEVETVVEAAERRVGTAVGAA